MTSAGYWAIIETKADVATIGAEVAKVGAEAVEAGTEAVKTCNKPGSTSNGIADFGFDVAKFYNDKPISLPNQQIHGLCLGRTSCHRHSPSPSNDGH